MSLWVKHSLTALSTYSRYLSLVREYRRVGGTFAALPAIGEGQAHGAAV